MSKQRINDSRDQFIPRKLSEIQKQVDDSKFQQPFTVGNTNVTIMSPVTVSNNSWTGAIITATPLLGQTLMGMMQCDVYRDNSSVGNNQYPLGANWSTSEVVNSAFETYDSYATSNLAPNAGKKITRFMIFKNQTGSDKSIIFVANTRVPDISG